MLLSPRLQSSFSTHCVFTPYCPRCSSSPPGPSSDPGTQGSSASGRGRSGYTSVFDPGRLGFRWPPLKERRTNLSTKGTLRTSTGRLEFVRPRYVHSSQEIRYAPTSLELSEFYFPFYYFCTFEHQASLVSGRHKGVSSSRPHGSVTSRGRTDLRVTRGGRRVESKTQDWSDPVVRVVGRTRSRKTSR